MAGLAVTGTGGDVLFIEATAMATGDNHGEAGLTRTDHTGRRDESAHIARSSLPSHSDALRISRQTQQSTVFTLDAP